MDLREIKGQDKALYNKTVTHIVQSWEWGEFRKQLGLPTLRFGIYHHNKLDKAFQITFHQIPLTSKYIGYLPKGPLPDQELAQALKIIAQKYSCAAIKVEPNTLQTPDIKIDPNFIPSPKPLFTKFNFLIDLTQSENTILEKLHPKVRYNIKVAQKHQVVVEERTDPKAFDIYLKLYFDTAKRQNYLGHNPNYHQKMWQTLSKANIAKLMVAFYTPPETNQKIPLTAWILFIFNNTLYYPYGGSSEQYKKVMASTLVAWETIKLGKKLNLKTLDLWGALPPHSNPSHPWQGFNTFKEKLGAALVEYAGSYDLVLNFPIYYLFTLIDRSTSLKVTLLKLLGK